MFTPKQIAGLKHFIFNCEIKDALAKRIAGFLIDQSEGLTKEVCLTLIDGREGFTGEEIELAAFGIDAMGSSSCTVNIDAVFSAMGTEFSFWIHYGDFDPTRGGDPFCTDGQFAGYPIDKVFDPGLVLEGKPKRYTFWLSEERYSRKAHLLTADRSVLEAINLNRPGLYPEIEAGQ